MKKLNKVKICLISSSGGHYEEIKSLRNLSEYYDIYFVSEKTNYLKDVDYILPAGSSSKVISFVHFILICVLSIYHIFKEKPDVIISTGTMVAVPTILWGKLLKKKIIYIETFARVHGSTKSARFIYKYNLYDLFIYQWESQREIFPDGIYGGAIF